MNKLQIFQTSKEYNMKNCGTATERESCLVILKKLKSSSLPFLSFLLETCVLLILKYDKTRSKEIKGTKQKLIKIHLQRQ